jgi:hypothetical protein
MSGIEIFHERFEYLTELQRHRRRCRASLRVDAVEAAMLARLHD